MMRDKYLGAVMGLVQRGLCLSVFFCTLLVCIGWWVPDLLLTRHRLELSAGLGHVMYCDLTTT